MEREITALKKSLNNAIGDWTDDKQMTGMFCTCILVFVVTHALMHEPPSLLY